MIDRDVVVRVLEAALSRGGDHADLFAEDTSSRSLSYEEGRVRSASASRRLGAGVRVVDGERSAYAHCDGLDPADLLAAARQAAAIARTAPPVPAGVVSRVGAARVDTVITPAWEASVDVRAGLCREAHDRAAADSRVSSVQASITDTRSRVLVAALLRSGEGVLTEEDRPMLRFAVSATARVGSRRETGTAGGGGRMGLEYFAAHPAAGHGAEAARKALLLLEAVPAPAGAMPVVLAPGTSGILIHEAVGHGLEGDFNRKGVSAYSGRVGEMVASPLVTVVDDGLIAGDRGSLGIDDEAVPVRRSVLIERGRLCGYLHDRQSARALGAKPAGNGRRENYRSQPMPRMRVTWLEAGPDSPDEIIASVRRGIYCVSFGGGSVDIVKGDFNFRVAEGYLIEDGRIGPAVVGATVIGNGPEAMRRVARVGHDLRLSDGLWTCGKQGQGVPVGQGLPTTLVSELIVGGGA